MYMLARNSILNFYWLILTIGFISPLAAKVFVNKLSI